MNIVKIEDDLLKYLENPNIESWNKVSENIEKTEDIHSPKNNSIFRIGKSDFVSPRRGALVYQTEDLLDEYTNVVETYYTSFYIQILKNYFNDFLFNMKIIEFIDYIQKLRVEHKKRIHQLGLTDQNNESFKIQMACKYWLNHIYPFVNDERCICKCALDLQQIISDVGRSITSHILVNISKHEKDKLIYIDTDSAMTKDSVIISYFKQAVPGFDIKTEMFSKVKFFNKNCKKKSKTPSWKEWFLEKEDHEHQTNNSNS